MFCIFICSQKQFIFCAAFGANSVLVNTESDGGEWVRTIALQNERNGPYKVRNFSFNYLYEHHLDRFWKKTCCSSFTSSTITHISTHYHSREILSPALIISVSLLN